MNSLTPQDLRLALSNPTATLRLLDKLDAQERLLDYIKLMWHVLEPGRQFVDGWAVHAICEHLEAVSRGEIRRLLMNVPPGCMKSLTTSVFWPSWEWGPVNTPHLRYVAASYSQSLTIRDNRRMRQLIQSDVYQSMWGENFSLSEDEANKIKFSNDHTGFKLATSVGGYVMGERGDRVIIDDPNNTKEVESVPALEEALQWITEVLPTRINDAEQSAIVIIMQRTHERDVSGHILRNELGYEHLMLPMEYEKERHCSTSIGFTDPRKKEGDLLWPERFPGDYLENDLKPTLRSWGGTYAEAGQLQQRPAPRGGGMFQKKDFQIIDEPPSRIRRRCRGWDLAASKDGHGAFTVGVKMSITGDGRVIIEDVARGRWGPYEVQEEISGCASRDGHACEISIPQDPGQAGKAQKAALATLLHGFLAHFSPETGAKEDRARPLAAQAEAGNLFLVRGPWNDAFINEAASFPMSQFKDQIDAASRAYSRLIQKRVHGIGAAPVLIGMSDG